MNSEIVEKIANSVLYEGHILYPYRPSAVKNRQRWNFGTLYPKSYSQAQKGTDPWSSQTECVISGSECSRLEVKVRFLHFLQRDVGELISASTGTQDGAEPAYRVVESIEVDGKILQTWQEAVERSVDIPSVELSEIAAQPRTHRFTFPSTREVQILNGANGPAGVVIRTQQSIEGSIEISAQALDSHSFRLTVRVFNLTSFDVATTGQEEASLRSLISAHSILNLCAGDFVSLLDPPEEYREAVAACRNIGVFPVLVGAEGERNTMLSSPIILYDYPQVAPESAGDFFDGTEMDEMLTLRVMTLTDEEKREMRNTDERARLILERTEMLPQKQMMKIHGAMRNLRNITENER
jgi:hypothetical protein